MAEGSGARRLRNAAGVKSDIAPRGILARASRPRATRMTVPGAAGSISMGPVDVREGAR